MLTCQHMRVIKAVKQNYAPTSDILGLLEDFRCMVNDCIRIGLEANVTSMKALSLRAYHGLDRYDVPTCYRLTAISKAAGILHKYRKATRKNQNIKPPCAKKPMFTDCYAFKIENGKLRLAVKPHQYAFIPLNTHTQEVILGYGIRSITLTDHRLSIAFSKEAAKIDHIGAVGIDRNLDNVTVASSDGSVRRFDLSKATETKALYRQVKSHMLRDDQRVRTSVFQKYGLKQRNKVQQILHHASKQIVLQAKQNRFGIVMENLTGIRKLYRKGNGQGNEYRSRLNSWSYYELQRQIDYKARWEGVPVIYVNPSGTSVKCSICGQKMKPEENRQLKCRSCGFTVDRDINAARNILARAVRFAAVASASEAMVQEPIHSEVILKVDADELTRRPTP